MCARDQCSIFSTGEKFCPDYELLLELHALTLVAHSYALLIISSPTSSPICKLYVCPSISRWGLVLPYFGGHGVSCLLWKVHVDGAATVVLQEGHLCPLVRGRGSKRDTLMGGLGKSNKLIESLGGQRSR